MRVTPVHRDVCQRAAALIVEAQACLLEAGDGMLPKPCPVSRRPCPCLMLAGARLGAPSLLPFRLIGRHGFIRLHRVEPGRPRDARRSIRCAPYAGAILARTDISLYSCFYRRYRLSEPLSTKSLIPRTYPVSNPISITYARTGDVFFMHAMPPSGLGQRGSVRHSKICAANSQHTPPRCKPRELGIDCCKPRAEVHGSNRSGQRRIVRSEDYGGVSSTRSCPW